MCLFEHFSHSHQGTLFVILRNNESVPSNSEVKTFFEKWGEVREVRDCKNNAGYQFE